MQFPGMMQMGQMGQPQQNKGFGDMGMKILQAALSQQGKDKAARAAQPQVGQPVAPGGPMNIVPPTLPNQGGILGMLKGMFAQPAQGGAPLDSTNALY